jgi:hypothetical protein
MAYVTRTGPRTLGGGASNSPPRPRIAGRPIYLSERKPAATTCRGEVVKAVGWLSADEGGRPFTVEEVYAAMAGAGTSWPRATVGKTMLRMTRPASARPTSCCIGRPRIGTKYTQIGPRCSSTHLPSFSRSRRVVWRGRVGLAVSSTRELAGIPASRGSRRLWLEQRRAVLLRRPCHPRRGCRQRQVRRRCQLR